MKSCYSIILKEAYKLEGWLDTYHIHKRYLLSPFQLVEACNEFVKGGVLEMEGRQVRLTSEGRAWVAKNRRSVFSSERPWANASPYLLNEKMQPDSPYFPDLSQLDADFFLKMLPDDFQ